MGERVETIRGRVGSTVLVGPGGLSSSEQLRESPSSREKPGMRQVAEGHYLADGEQLGGLWAARPANRAALPRAHSTSGCGPLSIRPDGLLSRPTLH